MTREVTERDLRMPDYRDVKVEELEFRSDGKIVRKDRFETGMRSVAHLVIGGRDYEILDTVERVRALVELTEGIDDAAGDAIWQWMKGDTK